MGDTYEKKIVKSKGTILASQDYILPQYFVSPIKKDHLRIVSTAAKCTTVLLNNNVCVDAGCLPQSLSSKIKLLLITHGHSDHSKDICNAFTDDDSNVLTIFCPASIAVDIFNMIKHSYQMNKGRRYEVEELSHHLKIYAVMMQKDEYYYDNNDNNDNAYDKTFYKEVITTIRCGDLTEIDIFLDNHKTKTAKYAIRTFPCHHTVDTIGYGVYNVSYRLKDVITIKAGTVIDVTPPKMSADEKKECKKHIKSDNGVGIGISKADIQKNIIIKKLNFDSVNDFIDIVKTYKYTSESGNLELDNSDEIIKTSIVSVPVGQKGYILDNIRRVEILKDITINMKRDTSGYIEGSAIKKILLFCDDYRTDMYGNTKIETHNMYIQPWTMVFGDTSATVFSQKIVRDMLHDFPRIIIESTFLEGEDTLSKIFDKKFSDTNKSKNEKRNLYLRLKDKKHIFLPEITHYFERYPDKQFILMHFSNRYDRETVISKINEINMKYNHNNVFAAV